MSAATSVVEIQHLTHRYKDVTSLDDITLEIADGEIVTLLGPSGCGKSTLLRVLAGFEKPASGTVNIGGRDMAKIPPHKRPVNMVFQRSTLFPHLDVYENIAFGLRVAGMNKREVAGRVKDALALVRLSDLARRRSHELSGGQLQRVALARALVNRPKLLLLDEPFSALDQQIRLEMEAELRRVHRATGATFLHVTHDQREALALSDRIAIMNHGVIEQIGDANQVYLAPASPFVARFVGNANVVPVEVLDVRDTRAQVRIAGETIAFPAMNGIAPGPAWLVVRQQSVWVERAGEGERGLRGTIQDAAFHGTGFAYDVAIDGLAQPVQVDSHGMQEPLTIGEEVKLSLDVDGCGLLSRDESEELDLESQVLGTPTEGRPTGS